MEDKKWTPDLTSPEGIEYAKTIVGKEIVEELLNGDPNKSDQLNVVDVDRDKNTITVETKKIVDELAQELTPEELKKASEQFHQEQKYRADHRAEVVKLTKHYSKKELQTLVARMDWDSQQMIHHINDLNKKIDELLKKGE